LPPEKYPNEINFIIDLGLINRILKKINPCEFSQRFNRESFKIKQKNYTRKKSSKWNEKNTRKTWK